MALRDAASDFRAELGELIGEAVQHEPDAGSVEQAGSESFPASDSPAPRGRQRARVSPATVTTPRWRSRPGSGCR